MSSKEKQSLTAIVWQHVPSTYEGSALVVMLKLAGLSSNKDGRAFVRVEPLAAMCGIKPRALQYLTRKLKKAKLLKVHNRKGHSNFWFLDVEEIKKLPLVSGPESAEESTVEEQVAETPTAQQTPAQEFATRLHETLTRIEGAAIPAEWQTMWTTEAQKLLDAGHNLEIMRAVTRYALGVLFWREKIAKDGARVLVENFTTMLEQYETFSRRDAA
jgi:hypothetical protein